MRAHTVHVQHEFAKPVDRVFAYLSEHENLGAIFPAKVERIRDGSDGHRNGVGASRRLGGRGLPPVEETVTGFVPNRRIEYRITKGSPLRGHLGVMEFAERPDGGSTLDYRIRFGSPVPGLAAIVKAALTRSIRAGLRKVDERS